MKTANSTSSDTTAASIEFALLQSWLASGSALELPLHQIESLQQAKGLEVQRLLLQAHLQHRGNGDVRPALRVQGPSGDLLYSHRRLGARSLTTVFGTVELVRMGYSRSGGPSIFPLDQALALPARSFSYELQRRLVKAAVQNPFLESVQTIAELTGVAVSKRSLEEILPDAAQDFNAFYRQRSPEPATGSILIAAVDGKGIPMVKPSGAQPKRRDLSAINRPKAAVPLARRRLSGEGGILFQLRLPLGGEGSARVSIWQGPPGHSPQGHDSIYLTFGRTEQPRSRLGRTRWRCDPSPLPCLSARFDHRAWPPAQTVA